MSTPYQLEVIAFTLSSCSRIQQAGAHRIELCDNPGEGGTTPSYGFIKQARAVTGIELYVMIRPRGGDFLYTEEEFELMQQDVLLCKQLGCDGVVTGLLLPDGTVDDRRTARLVELAYPMGVTFHRAFDRTRNAEEALEAIIKTGCERILTSGLHPDVNSGAENLAKLVKTADDRIIIMPGSGVRSSNLQQLAQQTGAHQFHTSARAVKSSAMMYSNPLMNEQLNEVTADEQEIRNCLAVLDALNQ